MKSKDSIFLATYQFPKKIADKIEEAATNGPWYWLPDSAYDERGGHPLHLERNPYYSCTIFKKGKKDIDVFKKYDLGFFSKYIGLHTNNIIRAHVTKFDPNPTKLNVHHNVHVDQEFEHIVALYYINDADGDTYFFDEKDKKTVIHRETPKRGRCVVFDGLHTYHASSYPTVTRMSLNINYEYL